MLDFYTNPMSRGQTVRWMLEEVGADYQERLMNWGPSMKGTDYKKINPMGKVPAIVHEGRVVTECAAICAYLADAFPDAKLAPPPAARHDYYRWLFFAAGPLEQAVTAKSFGWTPTKEQSGVAGFGTYDLVVETMEGLLLSRAYVCGDAFTAADVYFGAQVLWGTRFGSLPSLHAFTDYAERLKGRPAYQKAKARDDALIAEGQAST
ncbi:glutathione S-transferase family protein [Parvularcula dongshanensis]|uniref:Glutathione S-transferase n=1 Tax=Parvularcula dongshanensis TaxID=1173995 RepID=A0A840I2J0_9PROT|nr:glutathione S-transferase family protein [Parvularcula dongshanensis]MBB4658408.1 glutathione S-transferase [Parvularcula dongshanensis]